MGDRTHAFRFQVQTKLNRKSYTGGISYVKYDAQGNPVSEEELKNAVAVENGVYTFQLRHMEKIEMTMPYGVEYIVSKNRKTMMCRLQRKFRKKRNRNWTMVKRTFGYSIRKYRSDIYEYERSTAVNRNPADFGSVYGHDRGSIRNAGIFRTGIRNSQMGEIRQENNI